MLVDSSAGGNARKTKTGRRKGKVMNNAASEIIVITENIHAESDHVSE